MRFLSATTRYLLAAGLLLAAAPIAQAQYNLGTPVFTIPTLVLNAKAKAAPNRAASFAYAPTTALKASTVQGYVSRLKAKDPAASQAVAATFGPGKNDYGQVYHGLTKDSGLPENDAASALATFMLLGWMITNNVPDGNTITMPMARGVRAQVAPQLAATAQLKVTGAPARLGEEMKLLFVIVQGGWQSAIKEGTLPAYRQGIAAMFKNQYGLDMSLVKLTPQGFAKK